MAKHLLYRVFPSKECAEIGAYNDEDSAVIAAQHFTRKYLDSKGKPEIVLGQKRSASVVYLVNKQGEVLFVIEQASERK